MTEPRKTPKTVPLPLLRPHQIGIVLVTLFIEGFSHVLLMRLLRLLPAGAIVAGRVSHPLGCRAFPRRTRFRT
jgi:hypothetical protein